MNWQIFVELEDKSWFPHLFRDQITDALQLFTTEMKVYDSIIPEFLWVMQQSKTKKVIDLCSGGTGPWEYLINAIPNMSEVVERITLTDRYPNRNALKALSDKLAIVEYESNSVDALNVGETQVGVRTLFSCFHHFDTDQATSIIQDAVDKAMPICVFEFTGRRAINFFHTLVSTIVVFTRLLFKQPLTLSKLLFSYLLPIVPLVYFLDSIVSHLRTYSQDELRSMVANVKNADTFEWEIGENSSPRSHLRNTFLIGYPKQPQS